MRPEKQSAMQQPTAAGGAVAAISAAAAPVEAATAVAVGFVSGAARFLLRAAFLAAAGAMLGVAINSMMVAAQQGATRSAAQRAFFVALHYLLCMVVVYTLLSYSALRVSQDGKGNFSNLFFTLVFFSLQTQMSANLAALLQDVGWATAPRTGEQRSRDPPSA